MKFIVLLLFVLPFVAFSQNKEIYKIYNAEGKETSYDSLITNCKESEFVFFGEDNDNPISHWLEYVVVSDLYNNFKDKLIVGAEMFETDQQLVVNEFLDNKFSESKFQDAIKLWPNYKTDYKPILTFCKEKKIPFIATNIPRRYASMVSNKGFEILDSLSSDAKKYIAPLPINYDTTGCYSDMLKDMDKEHATPNIAKAQAIKDATMAYFILKNYKKGYLFYHFNGSYHSNKHDGIVRYITNSKKNAKIVVISTVSKTDITKLDDENKGEGDFIICVTDDMTRTY